VLEGETTDDGPVRLDADDVHAGVAPLPARVAEERVRERVAIAQRVGGGHGQAFLVLALPARDVFTERDVLARLQEHAVAELAARPKELTICTCQNLTPFSRRTRRTPSGPGSSSC